MACHTYMGEMETHISYRFLPLAVYFYTLSSVPRETQMLTVYTALKYPFPGSVTDCARIPFCNICNHQCLISYHAFCKIFDCCLLTVFNKHNKHFTAFNAYLHHYPLPASITNVDAGFLIASFKYSKSVSVRDEIQSRMF